MPYYDNPAGRLHELLRRLHEQNTRESLLKGWAAVLSVPEADVILHIGDVANLVRQIQEAVDAADEEVLHAPVRRLRDTWARPIFPPDQPFNGELRHVLPGDQSLESLGLVSAQLHLIASEGNVPDRDKLDELKHQVRDLIDEIHQTDEFSDDLKRVIASRLMDVEKAIGLVHVGGPNAVQSAMEAVVGTVLFRADPGKTGRAPAMQKLWATLGVLWVAFNAGPKIQDSIEAWPKIAYAITSGKAVDEKAAESPVPSPPTTDANED